MACIESSNVNCAYLVIAAYSSLHDWTIGAPSYWLTLWRRFISHWWENLLSIIVVYDRVKTNAIYLLACISSRVKCEMIAIATNEIRLLSFILKPPLLITKRSIIIYLLQEKMWTVRFEVVTSSKLTRHTWVMELYLEVVIATVKDF